MQHRVADPSPIAVAAVLLCSLRPSHLTVLSLSRGAAMLKPHICCAFARPDSLPIIYVGEWSYQRGASQKHSWQSYNPEQNQQLEHARQSGLNFCFLDDVATVSGTRDMVATLAENVWVDRESGTSGFIRFDEASEAWRFQQSPETAGAGCTLIVASCAVLLHSLGLVIARGGRSLCPSCCLLPAVYLNTHALLRFRLDLLLSRGSTDDQKRRGPWRSCRPSIRRQIPAAAKLSTILDEHSKYAHNSEEKAAGATGGEPSESSK